MKNKKLNIAIFIGLVLAIIGGIFFPSIVKKVSFLGTIFVNLLKFIIVPIVFSSIMVTVYNSQKKKDKSLPRLILLFIVMFIVTFLITSVILYIFKPGVGFKFDIAEWDGTVASVELSQVIVNLFPSNFVTLFQSGSLFTIIMLAFVLGLVARKVESGEVVIKFMEAIKDLFNKLLEYIILFTPVGVFALLGNAIADYGNVIFSVGLKYILFAYLCSFAALVVVMIIPACIYGKVNPVTFIKKMINVWMMTLTTCSSQATLPTTIKTCKEEFNIPSKLTDFSVPLGCTIHMCGGAVSFALLGIFCSQMFNIDINLYSYFLMIVSALLINMAAPGIPNGGIAIGAYYLSLLNFPLTFIGFYSGIYKLLDMAYTTLNVTGDVTATIIVNSRRS